MRKALYRKWRPSTFADVVGQGPIVTTLQNQIATNKLAHAYLFTGSHGTGKTTCAKILASAMNCLQPENSNPCGVCAHCKGIADGSILDVVEMDAASNNKVDDVRMLKEEIFYTPATLDYRVYIIDEVHMLSTSAFNALLKVMEEPPAYVVFILATTELHKVPATILSRCQRFDFKRISSGEIAKRLLFIASQEGFSLSDGAARRIALLSDGGMRDAISLLDLCCASTDEVDEAVVMEVAGVASKEAAFLLIEKMVEKNSGEMLVHLHDMFVNGGQAKRILEQLLDIYRDVMIVKTSQRAGEILEVLEEELAALESLASKVSMADCVSTVAALGGCYDKMGAALQKRTLLEMTLIGLSSAKAVPALEQVPQPMAQPLAPTQSSPVAAPGQSVQVPQPSAPLTEQGTQAVRYDQVKVEKIPLSQGGEAVPAGAKTVPKAAPVEDVPLSPLTEWGEVIEICREKNPAMYGHLVGSKGFVKGGTVLIEAGTEMLFELLKKSEQSRDSLRMILKEVTGKEFKLGPLRREQTQETTAQENPIEDVLATAKEMGVACEE